MHEVLSLPNVANCIGTFSKTGKFNLHTISGLTKLRWAPLSKKARVFNFWLKWRKPSVAVGKTLLVSDEVWARFTLVTDVD